MKPVLELNGSQWYLLDEDYTDEPKLLQTADLETVLCPKFEIGDISLCTIKHSSVKSRNHMAIINSDLSAPDGHQMMFCALLSFDSDHEQYSSYVITDCKLFMTNIGSRNRPGKFILSPSMAESIIKHVQNYCKEVLN